MRRDEEVRQYWRVGQGGGDMVQESRSNNTAAAPDPADRGEVEVPVIRLAGRRHDRVALGVGTDLRREQCVPQIVDRRHWQALPCGTDQRAIGLGRRAALRLQ